jgi:hypothetical protein
MLLFVVCLIVDASTLQLHDSITRDDDDRKRKRKYRRLQLFWKVKQAIKQPQA